MAITSAVTTLTLDVNNRVKLPGGTKYHRHVIFLDLNGANNAEINFSADDTATTLFPFGDVFTKSGDNQSCIIHDGVAPQGGSLWLQCDGTATTIKHYAYDRRLLGLSK
tara:strand:- start:346 stop:672 length:327 start_codon:yes stop_codon:yes gene_type:complete